MNMGGEETRQFLSQLVFTLGSRGIVRRSTGLTEASRLFMSASGQGEVPMMVRFWPAAAEGAGLLNASLIPTLHSFSPIVRCSYSFS